MFYSVIVVAMVQIKILFFLGSIGILKIPLRDQFVVYDRSVFRFTYTIFI